MSWNEIWSRPVSFQVQGVFAYYRERFEMIVQDLGTFEEESPVILEGAAYTPELTKQCDADPKKVIYLMPVNAFQIHHYQQRPWIQHILKEGEDPKHAFENWMMRY